MLFFSYISGGFGRNIDAQLNRIVDETGVNGSAVSVSNMIYLISSYKNKGLNHSSIKDIFSLNKQVTRNDIEKSFLL